MVTPYLPWKFHANRSCHFLVMYKETKKETKKETNKSPENNTSSPTWGGVIITISHTSRAKTCLTLFINVTIIEIKIVILAHNRTESKSKSRTVTKTIFPASHVRLMHASKLTHRWRWHLCNFCLCSLKPVTVSLLIVLNFKLIQ